MAVIPIPHRKKVPTIAGWQNLALTAADLPAHFEAKPMNLGVLLGAPSKGLMDVDLDAPEARQLATHFLPSTGAVFGRLGSPNSHWLYRSAPLAPYLKLTDPLVSDGRSVLIEIRSTGNQTVFPPSIHPSNEPIEWRGQWTEPAKVTAEGLTAAVRKVGAGALLVRNWPGPGRRHDVAMHLAGALISSGWSREEAHAFILAVAQVAGDDDPPDRARCADTTADRQAAGLPLTGITRMSEHLPARVMAKVCDWLGLQSSGDHPYSERPDGLFLRGERGDRRLTNFTARIVKDVVEDNGADTQNSVEIKAIVGERHYNLLMPVREFLLMAWPSERMGAGAVVSAGQTNKDHARAAIQFLSGQPSRRIVYTHTGWREVEGQWVFLHGDGAIGASGAVPGIAVKLPDRLAPLRLPVPPTGTALTEAVKASLRLLEVAPDAVTFPLLAAVYRSVLGDTDYAIALIGETGQGKSELAARAQQHFGSRFDRTHLPANFEDTANSRGALAFTGKDLLLVMDDFAPAGTMSEVQRLNREVGQIIRAQGNGAGRLRMKADATLREAKDPRGLLVVTGEDVPPGQSIRARTLVVQVAKDAVNWERMTAAQADGASGLYAAAMAAFIAAIAGAGYVGLQETARERHREYRARAGQIAVHRRTPDVVASLMVGLTFFTQFAAIAGVLTAENQVQLLSRGWNALTGGGAEQAAEQADQEPCQRFFVLLRTAIGSQHAHVVGMDDGPPPNAAAWGWQKRSYGGETQWEPKGALVGWLDGADLYLDPDVSYETARRAGDGLSIGGATLKRRLAEGKFLRTFERDRQRTTIRKTIANVQRTVLHVGAETIVDIAVPTVHTVPAETTDRPTTRPLL